ncbi:MAG: DnaB-like helicase C-terminal domain-containing protein, partial [bacterium]
FSRSAEKNISVEYKIEKFKKRNVIAGDIEKLRNFIEKYENEDYGTDDDIITEYNNLVDALFGNFIKRFKNVESADEEIECRGLRKHIKKQKERSKSDEGNMYFTVDDSFMADSLRNKGFASKRLYLFAAAPSHGKSQLLLNIYRSFITRIKDYACCQKKGKNTDDKVIYVPFFLTLENTIDETDERFNRCLLKHLLTVCKKQPGSFQNNNRKDYGFPNIDDINEFETILQNLDMPGSRGIPDDEFMDSMEELSEYMYEKDNDFMGHETAIIIKYFKAYETSSIDIISYIEDKLSTLNSENDDGYIYKCGPVMIDYLDLMKSSIPTDMYRLELGFIAMDLKSIALMYNVPVISLTQLNEYMNNERTRDGKYQKKRYSLNNLTESKKKAEHADAVAFIEPIYSVNEYSDQEDESKFTNFILRFEKYRHHKTSSYKYFVNREMHYIISQKFCSPEMIGVKTVQQTNDPNSYSQTDNQYHGPRFENSFNRNNSNGGFNAYKKYDGNNNDNKSISNLF